MSLLLRLIKQLKQKANTDAVYNFLSNLLLNTPGGVYVDGVVWGEGVAGVGTAVVGHQAGGPVHRPQVQPTLHHHVSCCYPS